MATTSPRWLNQPEGPRLEYKAARALRRPQALIRTVVGFLNAGRGGELVIGVDDAGHIEGVDHAERERDRLQLLVRDHIDPPPGSMVAVESLSVGRKVVLVVKVPAQKGLWAEKRTGLLGFWRREGAATVAIPLDEVRRRMSEADGDPPIPTPTWHAQLERESETVFVLQATDRAKQSEDDVLPPHAVEGVLAQRTRAEITPRPMGWSILEMLPASKGRGKTFEVGERGGRRWTRIQCHEGTVRFEGRASFLQWQPPRGIKEPVIYPYPLVEGTLSFFLLLQRLAEACDLTGAFLCELGLWRIDGWRLGPSRPDSAAWSSPDSSWREPYAGDPVEEVRLLRWDAIEPQTQTFSLIRGVYEWFGYDESAVPFWSAETREFRF